MLGAELFAVCFTSRGVTGLTDIIEIYFGKRKNAEVYQL